MPRFTAPPVPDLWNRTVVPEAAPAALVAPTALAVPVASPPPAAPAAPPAPLTMPGPPKPAVAAPNQTAPVTAVIDTGEWRWQNDHYEIAEENGAHAGWYRVTMPSSEGQRLVAIGQCHGTSTRKRLCLYEDETCREPLMSIRAHGRSRGGVDYDVLDEAGHVLGVLDHHLVASLLRTKWHLRDAHGAEVAIAEERNQTMAAARRGLRFVDVPVVGTILELAGVGSIADWVPLPKDLTLMSHDGAEFGVIEQALGQALKITAPGPAGRHVDRRLLIALAAVTMAFDG